MFFRLTFREKSGLTLDMKGKPSKVAKRRLHETPSEFAEAVKGKQTERYKYWQRLYEREAEWYRNAKMPSHPQPQRNKEMQRKGRMTNRARYYRHG